MDSTGDGSGSIFETIMTQLGMSASYLPGLLTAIVILVIGWLLARLARRAVRKLATASNRLLERAFPGGQLSIARAPSLTVTLLGEFVFWATLLITVTVAARVSNLGAVSVWLERLTAHLPHLVAGVSIVVIGYLLGVFAREKIAPPDSEGATSPNDSLGRVVQYVVVATATIVALDQVGIDVVLLIALAVALTAAVLIALAVAFALGARSHVSNLVGMRAARDQLATGMRIQIGDVEGEIVEITASQVALETPRGKVLVPGRMLDEAIVCLLTSPTQMDHRDG